MTRSVAPTGRSFMALRALRTGRGHRRPLASRMAGPAIASAEPIVLGKPARDDAARLGARADPGPEVGLRAGLVSTPPRQPLAEAEGLEIGETAVLVALQDHASPPPHLRNLREREQQQ